MSDTESEFGVRLTQDQIMAIADEFPGLPGDPDPDEAQESPPAATSEPGDGRPGAPPAAAAPKTLEAPPEGNQPPAEPTEPVSAQILARARREKALRAREEALKAAQNDLEALVEQRLQAKMAELEREALRNPAEFFRKRGVSDLHGVASSIWAAELGDDAPEQFRQRVAQQKQTAELDELRREINEWKEQQRKSAEQAQLNSYLDGLRHYVHAIPDSLPYLKREFDRDPEATFRAVCKVAGDIASTGRVPEAREVGEALNQEIESLVRHHYQGRVEPSKSPSAAAIVNRAEPETLSPSLGAGTPARPSDPLDLQRIYKECEDML